MGDPYSEEGEAANKLRGLCLLQIHDEVRMVLEEAKEDPESVLVQDFEADLKAYENCITALHKATNYHQIEQAIHEHYDDAADAFPSLIFMGLRLSLSS